MCSRQMTQRLSMHLDSLLEVLDEMPDALGVVLAQDDGREQIRMWRTSWMLCLKAWKPV